MVVACFEDCPVAREKIFAWKPVHTDALPKFRLLHPKYWEEGKGGDTDFGETDEVRPQSAILADVVSQLNVLA